jgi:Arc/MetJ family transcription regulator
MGRTNIILDDVLLKKCFQATGLKTRRRLIDFALRELLRHENQKKILQLKGAVTWEGDMTSMRKGRQPE